MDKAPDAFRTISEVADELDIPQHVLRFWETRFAQIKPMKRSGGRRYYRPDDVDLLKGIRRLLYGEGYTIRGVQRILKEHGIKSVQGIADQTAAVSFGAVEEAVGHSMAEPDDAGISDGFDLDGEEGDGDEKGIDYRFVDPDQDAILSTYKARAQPAKAQPAAPPVRAGIAAADRERLERALQELVVCRQVIDSAMKDGDDRGGTGA
ncbi:MerR family transcriptional regulator [Bradyrhizobium sp. ISRA443]|uniref:MerR family transcriptional regulator n=1 Tax=unclassified Bradyrhizobium TaxID=2631580 RepID=UPI00247AAEDE|nr:MULTISPECIES: MerR family transcriptional regulator [unclassified Bradyrhizobium]WGR91892.1 MerR family transcriptional regulator [Bradyrhizobium sp. ISRA435]WGS02274.1 MerR family transcriptional regulator [Bradyrhizobium sp. ISRA436]WGS09159.1 MerR family transcriptional regulator [Bradyrhizobium sp. ISRA437]WGS16048.1 MerR family transcriptional regulator [Bradyrhizobium sp. ISRA443]